MLGSLQPHMPPMNLDPFIAMAAGPMHARPTGSLFVRHTTVADALGTSRRVAFFGGLLQMQAGIVPERIYPALRVFGSGAAQLDLLRHAGIEPRVVGCAWISRVQPAPLLAAASGASPASPLKVCCECSSPAT